MTVHTLRGAKALAAAIALGAAFALGSTGTSAAVGLTRHTVKQIAAQVIKKKAGSLDVARADLASNAASLGGRPPQAYQDSATVFTQRVLAPTTDITLVLLLNPGDWYVSWSARFTPATNAECWLDWESSSGKVVVADDGGSSLEDQAGHSASGVVHVDYGSTGYFHCHGTPAFTTPAVEPLQIVATPLDSVNNASLIVFGKRGVTPRGASARR